MIAEFIVAGSTLLGCVACWMTVHKHRITSELQKFKIDTDYKVLNPPPPAPIAEKPMPPDAQQQLRNAQQQALNALLKRREVLEDSIKKLREAATTCRVEYNRDISEHVRADALRALQDAREEQREIVSEEHALLAAWASEKKDDEKVRVAATPKSVQPDPGGSVAQSLDDPSLVCDVELHDEEAGRESTA